MTATSQHTDPVHVTLTVGQVAERFGVTVRTLHHYDEIGLLVPSARSHAGYRLYTEADLVRLATVVTYRRLGLPLEKVQAALAGDGSVTEHLLTQRAAVMTEIERLHRLLDDIDTQLEADMHDRPATTEDLQRVFGDGYDETWQQEAEQRWGGSPQWRESQQRTAERTPAQWERTKADTDALGADLADALRRGVPADSDEADALAERHRASIEEFYACPHAFHRNLGDLYVTDPRFTATYDALEPGLAAYVRDVIHANADRHDS